jgi:hypothetical protein
VERAEIQYEPNGRSRGTGVVEFENKDDAETAICKSGETGLLASHAHNEQQSSPATNMVVGLLA